MIIRSIKQKVYRKRLDSHCVPEVFRRCFDQAKGLDTKKAIRNASFVVFDTEATGLRPEKGDSLISVAGIGLSNGRVDLSKSFYELIKPEREVPPESVIIHGLTPGKLRNLPPASEVLARFFEFCGGDVLVGHHTSFDVRFLNRTLKEHFGITLANRVLDTALIGRAIQRLEEPTKVAMEGTRHMALEQLAKRFNISMPDRHDAYGDAFATALIFQRQIGILHKEGIRMLKDLMNLGEVK